MSREPELRWTVPDSWTWTSLSELGDIVAGGTPSTKEPSYWADEVHWISPSDLTGYSAKTIKQGAKSISRIGLANSSAKVMPAGSVHFSSRAPIGYVVISAEALATNQGFKSLVPAPGIFNEYVYYYLLASREYAHKRASGTMFLELSGKAFGCLPIPLAPTATQRRIVAKIDELFSELDKGIESLKTARRQLEVYRQSILKHAFEGTLTAQWRAQNADQLQSSESLLARIRQAHEDQQHKQLTDWKTTVRQWEANGKEGKKPKKPRELKSVAMLAEEEVDCLEELPSSWQWLPAESVGIIQLGRQRSPKKRSRNYPTKYIRAANITEQGLDLGDVLDMDFGPHELSAYRLGKGDLVLSEASGSAAQVGKPAIWDDQIPNCCFQNTVIRHQPYCRDHAAYLLWLYRFFYVSGKFARVAGGVGINHLSAYKFAQIALPVCPFLEQQEIVRLLEGKFTSIEQNEREIDSALKRAELLRQAILKKAFAGQLVAQDPDDEPASVLLYRIKVEKEQISKKAGTTRKTRRKRTSA